MLLGLYYTIEEQCWTMDQARSARDLEVKTPELHFLLNAEYTKQSS
jgi:hypothetical protein